MLDPAFLMERVMVDSAVRVRLSRKKGWRKPPNTVVVSRPTTRIVLQSGRLLAAVDNAVGTRS